MAGATEVRSFDGSGNNVVNDNWGAANTQLLRLTTVEYGPGPAANDQYGNIVFPAMAVRVDSNGDTINPRTVSNLIFNQDESVLNDRGLTSFVFQWGQFLDHDMDLTEDFVPVGQMDPNGVIDPGSESISFFVPTDGTESELPAGTIIPQLRSRFQLDDEGIAQQINQITSYIDASNVYGSDAERADNLRAHYGGFLLTSDGVNNLADGSGQFLPLNYLVDGKFIENASPPTTGNGVPLSPDDLFVAGDVRANEQPGLTTLHTLFVREHNYQATRLAKVFGYSSKDLGKPKVDERIFQAARAIVIAEIQSITYNEFLPSLLGPDQLASYRGYQAEVNASIANLFSASLYRVGHTMLPNELLVLQPDGSPVADDSDVLGSQVIGGQVSLGDAFFNPELITQYGIESYLTGLSTQQIQEIDNLIVDGVRNLLFDPPAAVDLGATNLQRGRDHGLADYNEVRRNFGLEPMTDFAQITSDSSLAAALAMAYDGNIDNIDVFAGAISEDHISGGSVGELMQAVLVDQFTRLRDGDRFYFENQFGGKQLAVIQNTRLSDIIRRNTTLDNVADEVFRSEDVFTYRAQEGQGSANITLRVGKGELQVTQGASGKVLASQPVADTSIVVIYGTGRNDTIRIDASVATGFAGSVEVHGGNGRDRLIVDGSRKADNIAIEPTEINVNGLPIFYGNVEQVMIYMGRGNDIASVSDQMQVNVTVYGGAGADLLIGGDSPGNLLKTYDIWTMMQDDSTRLSRMGSLINTPSEGLTDALIDSRKVNWQRDQQEDLISLSTIVATRLLQ
ncbi:MAG: peroxidase [Planctomycetaceae bacterium]|nr:peroxidase [Planctomycetaceae bacterium]